MSAVELRDVFRVHSTPEGDAAALQGLTLTVAEGELLAVLGPSGSGKTSMLRLLAGVDRASAGTARVFGSDLGRLGAVRLRRGHDDLPPSDPDRRALAAGVQDERVERRPAKRRASSALRLGVGGVRPDLGRKPASRVGEIQRRLERGPIGDREVPSRRGEPLRAAHDA